MINVTIAEGEPRHVSRRAMTRCRAGAIRGLQHMCAHARLASTMPHTRVRCPPHIFVCAARRDFQVEAASGRVLDLSLIHI